MNADAPEEDLRAAVRTLAERGDILAAVAEHEREMISVRTKAALEAARARGVKLGNPNLRRGDKATSRVACAARTTKANEHAADVGPFIDAARRAGAGTFSEIARALNARGVRTPGGGARWTDVQVRRTVQRVGESNTREPALARSAKP